ncbi:hypothetical protein TNCV_2933841 [Trichonephila clavipes]|nr:hypothetical protein TNCV_2933841 [Trichonephila clavipes]
MQNNKFWKGFGASLRVGGLSMEHHLELQGRRDYTPADRTARTCWLGRPGAPVLSGGLRRKTQLFSGTLYMAASSKTPPHQSKKILRSSTPRSKCQFSQGAVCCVVIPVVKNHQTTSFHSVWSATGLRRKTSSWRASTHHGVQQGRQCAVIWQKTRHGAYLKYTQNIMLQHQGEDPTGKPDTLTCSTNPTAVSLRRLRREVPPAD